MRCRRSSTSSSEWRSFLFLDCRLQARPSDRRSTRRGLLHRSGTEEEMAKQPVHGNSASARRNRRGVPPASSEAARLRMQRTRQRDTAAKLQANRERDADTDRRLAEAGWLVLRFWEHEAPGAATQVVLEAVRARQALRF